MKLEIKGKYGVKHALKLPAHITLLPPFWLETEREKDIFESLNAATGKIHPFQIVLKDFGRFGQRVIYIKVLDPEPVKQVHREIFNKCGELIGNLEEQTIHPHMTIATRDLTKEKFQDVWSEFQKREFNNSFKANSLFLFRHNGKTWDIIGEFPMNN